VISDVIDREIQAVGEHSAAGWPSWLVSVATHGVLLAVAFWLARNRPAQGAAGESTREVGIVLKSVTEAGPMFEGEDDQDVESDLPSEATASHAAIDALPSEMEMATGQTALPQLPQIGPGDLEASGAQSASAMTQGAPPSRRGGSGGEARVKVFGVEGVGTTFLYVFDHSTSMEGKRLAAAKRELIQSLDSLDAIHRFHIIFFNDRLTPLDLFDRQNRMATGTDRDKALAKQFINSVTAGMSTIQMPALEAALRFQPDVIFFLTDADSPMQPRDVADVVRRAGNSGTAIQCIEFGVGPRAQQENFLVQIARETGGQYGYVDALRLGR